MFVEYYVFTAILLKVLLRKLFYYKVQLYHGKKKQISSLYVCIGTYV